MNHCERCGRPGPGGICPDCARLAPWSMSNDDTLGDIPVIDDTELLPNPRQATPRYVPQGPRQLPPPSHVAPSVPPSSIYRTGGPQPSDSGFRSSFGPPPSTPYPPAGVAPGPGTGRPQAATAVLPSAASRKRRSKGVAGVVVLSVFGVAVLAGGTVFAAGMLRGDDGATTTVSSLEPTPTLTVTPSPTSPPMPAATVTVTATATETAAPGPTAAESAASELASKPAASKKKSAPPQKFDRFYPLGTGDQGYVVETLQRILSWRGVRTYVDGDFGNATERSVRQWQAKEGLSVTGVVDDTTWESLLPKLKKGSSGDAVTAMQQVLAERGYSLEVDGDFGKQTDRVVREFQSDRGLTVDGVVGPITWAALLA